MAEARYSKKLVDGKLINYHTALIREILDKEVPKGVHVHHVDGNGKNNSHDNLVVCQDAKYHQLLHARQRALDEVGNADYMKCPYCKEYDNPANMYVRSNIYQAWHRECAAKYKRTTDPKTGPYRYLKGNKYAP